jgi:hypothetical protein
MGTWLAIAVLGQPVAALPHTDVTLEYDPALNQFKPRPEPEMYYSNY